MRVFYCLVLQVFFFIFCFSSCISVFAFENGSPGGYTNSPYDGLNCTACHSGVINSGNSISAINSNIPSSGYVPGQIYTITASISLIGITKFGFELTSEDNSNNKTGTILVTNSIETQLANNSAAITHTASGNTGVNSKIWSFDWQAPATGTGSVEFFGSFVAANNNSNNNGDQVSTSSFSVSEFSPLPCNLILSNIINSQCNSGNSGSVQAQGNGGAGLYHYTLYIFNTTSNIWVPIGQSPLGGGYASTAPNFPSLTADSFRVVMEDSLGCSDTAYFAITEPPPIVLNGIISNTSNPFTNNGSIIVNVSGGTPQYTYSWIGPSGFSSSSLSINNLAAGTYVLTVTDANGCIKTEIYVVETNQSCSSGIFNQNPVACYGDSTGSINISGVYGTPQFSYLLEHQDVAGGWLTYNIINTIDTFIVFDNLIAGWYRYTLTDNLNCTETSSLIQITESPVITVNSTITNATSTGSCDGAIDLFVSGGSGPFNYSWSNGLTGSAISSLCEDWYCVEITDINGCSLNWCDSVIVQAPCLSLFNIDIDSSLETCAGNDAFIQIIIGGGSLPYLYSLDGGSSYDSSFSNTILIDSLTSGNYNIVVIDSANCFENYGNVFIGNTSNPSIDSITTINESCCGGDGQILVHSTSTFPIIKYSLDTLQTFQDSMLFQFLNSGSYLVHIEDINQCIDSAEVFLYADSIPNINMTVDATDIVCYGDTNGTFKVYYPDSCYEYALWRYTLFTPQVSIDTGSYFNELISGYYGIVATSNSGYCIDSSSVHYIAEPNLITYDAPVSSASYCSNIGSCNGTLQLPNSPTGGVPPYQYYNNEIYTNIPSGLISTDSTFFNLCEGIYEIQVVDANACVIADTVVIQDSSIYIDSLTVNNISCFGINDGAISIYAHGGVGGYSYFWSDSSTTQSIDSLSPGNYIVTVQDSAFCYAVDSAFLIQPDTLLFKILENGKIPESCLGVSYDGEIYLEITGGTGPFTHSWSSASGLSGVGIGDTLFNLTSDTITINVFDMNGCVGSASWGTINTTIVEALNSSNLLNIDSIYTNITPICFESLNGTMQVDINSGDSPFQYSIDNGSSFSNDSIFINLLAGIYDIVVIDTYGCSDSAQAEIIEYSQINIEPDSINHVSCYDGSDGYISITASGGIGGYTYLWSPTLDTTSIISMLEAYTYTVNVKDSAGCIQIDTIYLEELTNPIQSSEATISHLLCYEGRDGSASIQVSGGMPFSNGDYLFAWIDVNNDTIANSYFAENLSAGEYLVIVSDSFGCGPFIDTVMLNQPDYFFVDLVQIQHNICFGDQLGSILVEAQGGTNPFSNYFRIDSNLITHDQASPNFSGLSANSYSFWVEDANGCISDTLQDIKLGEPGKIATNTNITELSCFGFEDGQIETALSGGTSPYNYWVSSNFDTINQGGISQGTSFYTFNLSANSYTFSFQDFNDCVFDTVISILNPEEVIAYFSVDNDFGEEVLSVDFINQSTGADSFLWDFNDGNYLSSDFDDAIQHNFTQQGKYEVWLVAENTNLSSLCNDTTSLIIHVQGYDAYNVFSPNGDNINDYFDFQDWKFSDLNVSIFNRWGQKVYDWNRPHGYWDGKSYNGQNLPEGVYYYIMYATGENGSSIEEKGSVTLLR